MSDSPTSPTKRLTTIGAQDLIEIGATKSGFLRKEGKIERELSRLKKVGGSFKWRRKYVILSKGCVYVYDNEDSRSPKSVFSLTGYNRVLRYEGGPQHIQHAFQIVLPGEIERRRTFSAAKDDDRLDWMRAIYEMMMFANGKLCPSVSSYNYQKLEVPIFEDTQKRFSKALKAIDEEYDSSSDEDYDKIDEKKIDKRYKSFPRELPPVPGSSEQKIHKPKLSSPEPEKEGKSPSIVQQMLPLYQNDQKGISQRPTIAPKPAVTLKHQSSFTAKPADESEEYTDVFTTTIKLSPLTPADYEFESTDSAKAKELLTGKPLGTFLIRPSNSDASSKVITVQAKDDVKQYKIITTASGVTLDKENKFISIKDLVEHYRISYMPNSDFKLTKGYKS